MSRWVPWCFETCFLFVCGSVIVGSRRCTRSLVWGRKHPVETSILMPTSASVEEVAGCLENIAYHPFCGFFLSQYVHDCGGDGPSDEVADFARRQWCDPHARARPGVARY